MAPELRRLFQSRPLMSRVIAVLVGIRFERIGACVLVRNGPCRRLWSTGGRQRERDFRDSEPFGRVEWRTDERHNTQPNNETSILEEEEEENGCSNDEKQKKKKRCRGLLAQALFLMMFRSNTLFRYWKYHLSKLKFSVFVTSQRQVRGVLFELIFLMGFIRTLFATNSYRRPTLFPQPRPNIVN
jgi:hypothetical protein